jgi:rRNA maturation endonuclease Nob1
VKKKAVEWSDARIKGRLPPQLVRCPGCHHHIYPQSKACPHCGGVLTVLKKKQLQALRRAQAAAAKLQKLFENA